MALKSTSEIEDLWMSLLSKEDLLACDKRDEVLLKVTLLAHATMKQFTCRSYQQSTINSSNYFPIESVD